MKLKSEFIKLARDTRLYHTEFPIIGLTGGIASGKSTASNYLKSQGLFIICADQLVKNIYKNDKTIDAIRELAPEAVNHNSINFKILREIFFSDSSVQEAVENLIYSNLEGEFKKDLIRLPHNQEVIIYDVPLLFEKNLDKLIDLSLCIYSTPETQIDRLIKRDGTPMDLVKEILAKQLPIEEKKKMANVVVVNEGTTTNLEEELDLFVESFLEK